jgi:hypothetical protein
MFLFTEDDAPLVRCLFRQHSKLCTTIHAVDARRVVHVAAVPRHAAVAALAEAVQTAVIRRATAHTHRVVVLVMQHHMVIALAHQHQVATAAEAHLAVAVEDHVVVHHAVSVAHVPTKVHHQQEHVAHLAAVEHAAEAAHTAEVVEVARLAVAAEDHAAEAEVVVVSSRHTSTSNALSKRVHASLQLIFSRLSLSQHMS